MSWRSNLWLRDAIHRITLRGESRTVFGKPYVIHTHKEEEE